MYDTLRGTDLMIGSYDSRIDPLHRLLPDVTAWCVIRIDRSSTASRQHHVIVWPHQAHAKRPWAEEWRDFLEDYYRDTHSRDGDVEWRVCKQPVDVGYYNAERRLVGSGCSRGRHPWAGTLPMEVFEFDPDKYVWRRKP
jgi:hypothetical protein